MMRIGIDVGGTHTDAVLMDKDEVVASTKALTSADVFSGILNALDTLLTKAGVLQQDIEAIMIGTTQFTNAVVERRELCPVATIRLALPSGDGIPPMFDWPEDLTDILGDHTYMVKGGYLYDNWPVSEIDKQEIGKVIREIKNKGLSNIAVASAFSTMNPEPELIVEDMIRQVLPEANITLSHRIGRIGLLERENAAILNTSLLPFAKRVVAAFESVIERKGIRCPVFVSQNDGTLMKVKFVEKFPALTFASGPTNSLRGASKLTGIKDAIVVDVGGTTADIGVLQGGFPRESGAIVDIGGVRTNFRMPDVKALPIGGGSVVAEDGKKIGPLSVGHNLVTQGRVFGGDTLTTTDIIVAAGLASIGDFAKVKDIAKGTIQSAIFTMQNMLDQGIDMMKLDAKPVPVILVGGGALLVQGDLSSASMVIKPKYAEVANAIGASIAQISGESEKIVSYHTESRHSCLERVTNLAVDNAVMAGADLNSIEVVEVEETNVPYMDGNKMKVRVKVVGEVATLSVQQANNA